MCSVTCLLRKYYVFTQGPADLTMRGEANFVQNPCRLLNAQGIQLKRLDAAAPPQPLLDRMDKHCRGAVGLFQQPCSADAQSCSRAASQYSAFATTAERGSGLE